MADITLPRYPRPLSFSLANVLGRTAPIVRQLSVIVVVLVIWDIAVRITKPRPDLLPSPERVAEAAWSDRVRLWEFAQPTLIVTGVGLAVAFAVAVVVAALLDYFPSVASASLSLFVGAQAVPIVAIAPLMVIWFGFGLLPKILLIVIATFFPLTIATLEGFRSADGDALRLMRSMGASRFQTFVHLKIPTSIPFVMTGLRVVVSYAVTAAIFAEYVGSEKGLGIYLLMAKNSLRTDLVFAVVVVAVVVSVTLFLLTYALEAVLAPWDRHRKKAGR